MRVLVVDDDHRISELVSSYLLEQGYAVDACFNGEAALDSAAATEYDVIILDVMLPLLDGFTVCRKLRRQRINTPVLMLTARDSLDDRVDGLDCGADDYLTKPFALRELGARVRALCRRPRERSPILNIADLVINTATHEVSRAGRTINLNPKEYAILEYLAYNTERIVKRTILEEHVWSYEFQPSSNIVDVYIGRLRRKIDDGYALKLLETIRGTGYRLHHPRQVKE